MVVQPFYVILEFFQKIHIGPDSHTSAHIYAAVVYLLYATPTQRGKHRIHKALATKSALGFLGVNRRKWKWA